MIERVARGIERGCDGVLDFVVFAFAGWTVIYHVSLLAGLGALTAGAIEVAVLVPAAWAAFFTGRGETHELGREVMSASPSWRMWVLVANAVAGFGAAALFAFTGAPWWLVWLLFVLAAAAALVATSARLSRKRSPARVDDVPSPSKPNGALASLAPFVALGWALAFATITLFTLREDADDAYYVRLSAWIAEHGDIPVRDVVFSDQTFPALVYPHIPSLEALAGTIARAFGVEGPTVVYLLVAPAVTAAVALGTWRLLRAWRAPNVALTLSVAMLFLLLSAQPTQKVDSVPISASVGLARSWQGKFAFAMAFVVLLFALLHEYAERPGKRQLALLAAAGAAGVGLTATAVFVIPVVVVGCLAPLVLRSWREAAAGLAAALAYPLGVGVVTIAVGGHAVVANPHVPPETLATIVLGAGLLAFLGMSAIPIGPTLIRQTTAAPMVAGTALLLALLLAPPSTRIVFELTDLGRVQWRFLWAVPVAALVAVLATAPLARARVRAVRLVPAAVLLVALAVWGAPLSARVHLIREPSWKRSGPELALAREIVAAADDGDIILAERNLSQTLIIVDGTITTVVPRAFYARALRDVPAARVSDRLLLMTFVEDGLGAQADGKTVQARDVRRALRSVGVDLACVPRRRSAERRVLLDAGYTEYLARPRVVCFEASGR